MSEIANGDELGEMPLSLGKGEALDRHVLRDLSVHPLDQVTGPWIFGLGQGIIAVSSGELKRTRVMGRRRRCGETSVISARIQRSLLGSVMRSITVSSDVGNGSDQRGSRRQSGF